MHRNAIVCVLVMAASTYAAADEMELIDLSTLIPGATDTGAFDISPAGRVVGTVRIDSGEQRVALWTMTSGEVLDSVYGSEYAQGINDDGVIVGSYIGSGVGWFYRAGVFDCIPLPDPCGSFNNLWRASSGQAINTHGVFTGAISPAAGQPANDPVEAYLGSFDVNGEVAIERLGAYLGAGTSGFGINDDGEVVGVGGSGLDTVALLFRDGQVSPLPDLDGGYNWAEAINNHGVAVGIASSPDPGPWPYDAEAVAWDTRAEPITVAALGRLPGHRLSRAHDVNNHGLVVGFSVDAGFTDQRAVIWRDGQITDLNELLPPDSDWRLEVATAVNDAGEVVGTGRRAGLPGRRAFLIRPAGMFAASHERGDLSEWGTAVASAP
jgi:probable HAF family extracellular repeat protein